MVRSLLYADYDTRELPRRRRPMIRDRAFLDADVWVFRDREIMRESVWRRGLSWRGRDLEAGFGGLRIIQSGSLCRVCRCIGKRAIEINQIIFISNVKSEQNSFFADFLTATLNFMYWNCIDFLILEAQTYNRYCTIYPMNFTFIRQSLTIYNFKIIAPRKMRAWIKTFNFPYAHNHRHHRPQNKMTS